MEENNQNGQLSNDQSMATSGKGANFSTQNTGGKVIGNDTATVGSGGVVSLKGGQTQSEINEQKRIEELKSRAVKLERKLTPREKELEKLHKQAVKPVSPVGKFQGTNYNQDIKNKAHNTNNVQNAKHDNQKNSDTVNSEINYKKQEELVEDLINPTESLGKPKNTENFIQEDSQQKASINHKIEDTNKSQDTNHKTQTDYKKQDIRSKIQSEKKQEEKNISAEISKEKQVKKIAEQKPVKRMVISPAGQISYVDNQKIEKDITKEEKQPVVDKGMTKDSGSKSSTSSNIVNLKSKEKNSAEKQMDASSTVVKNKNITKTPKTPNVLETPWEDKKVDLKELSPEKRIDMQATPSMASVNFNMDDDFNKEMVEWFDTYNELPINIKLGLGSQEVRQKIKELATKNKALNEKALGEISRIVRDVYTKLIKTEEIKKRLQDVLKLKEDTIDDAIKEIGSIVGEVKEVGNRKSNDYFEKLSLEKSIEKYPNIAAEEITTGKISNKQTGEYIDPTIQNWINDYISQMGSDKHTNLERGKYLNDSTNTKNLNQEDKKIIEKLTKSYDEGSKLIIDREEEVILWNLHEDESRLGINSDRSKRVINKFKIEEAQTADVDNSQNNETVITKMQNTKKKQSNIKVPKQVKKNRMIENSTMTKKSSLENNADNSIIKDSSGVGPKPTFNKGKLLENKKETQEEELLDLSSEIPVK